MELRRLRARRGWSGPQLAERLGWSQSKVSRLETADRTAAVADVSAWLEAVGAEKSVRDELIGLAESLLRQATGLRSLHRGTLARRASEIVDMDSAAARVRQFQPLLVPGVFHTEAYAKACIDAANLSGELDVPAAVVNRVTRGRRLVAGGPPYHAVVCEQALRWRPATDDTGDGDVLAGVWQRLTTAARKRNVTVQVIPLGTEMAALPQCGFTMWEWTDQEEPSLVLVETPAAEVTFTGAADIAMFEQVWSSMLAAALSPRDTIRWLVEHAPG